MSHFCFVIFCITVLPVWTAVSAPLFLEVEKNSPEIFSQFDQKNAQTLSLLSGERGFEELHMGITSDLDRIKEYRKKKKGVSYTKSWAYTYRSNNEKPKGDYLRVKKSIYKKFKSEDRLSEVPWTVVVDIDHFIRNQAFPSRITQPSLESWTCLREDESRELKRCLIGFSQAGGDRKVFYEFDFHTLSWVKEQSFQYEILGLTSFKWIDENQVLVAFDEMSHYNHHNPENPLSMEEAIARGMISSLGYPIKLMIWNRGESSPSKMIFQGNSLVLTLVGRPIEMKGRPKEKVLYIYEKFSGKKTLSYVAIQTTSGTYEPHLIALPENVQFDFIPMDEEKIRMFFSPKSQWIQADGVVYDERDLLYAELEITSPEKVAFSPPRRIFRLPKDKGLISSISVTKGNEFDPTDDRVIINVSHNISESVILLSQVNGKWKNSLITDPLELKYKSLSVSENSKDKSLSVSVKSFLHPDHKYTLKFNEEGEAEFELVNEGLLHFDSSNYKVDQLWVDRGVDQNGKEIKVPYFIIYNPSRVQLSENSQPAPTLLYAYGGFGRGLWPRYLGILGKYWLDRGGVYVKANIRGGDEFGSYWHQSALKKNRSNSYGDFYCHI